MSSVPVRANGGAPAPSVYGWWATPSTLSVANLRPQPMLESTRAPPLDFRHSTERRNERGAFLPADSEEPDPPTGAVSPSSTWSRAWPGDLRSASIAATLSLRYRRAPVGVLRPLIVSYCGWSHAPRLPSLRNDHRDTFGSGADCPSGV